MNKKDKRKKIFPIVIESEKGLKIAFPVIFLVFILFLIPFILTIILPFIKIYSNTTSIAIKMSETLTAFETIINDPIFCDVFYDENISTSSTLEDKEKHLAKVFNNLYEQGFTIVENEGEDSVHIYNKEKGYDLKVIGGYKKDGKTKVELIKNGKYWELDEANPFK